MAKVVRPKSAKGSQHWLQELVKGFPQRLSDPVKAHLNLNSNETITWLSPREDDDYAEYSDAAFLDRLEISLKKHPLPLFWPSGGPVWDGLGKSERGDILLIEAKAHCSELDSHCQAGESSLALIQRSLAETGQYIGVTSTTKWTNPYYQYANRLAHLYLLRQLNDLPAWLIFLYFVGDQQMGGPSTEADWRPSINAVHEHLGIKHHALDPFIIELFVDVATLQSGDGAKK